MPRRARVIRRPAPPDPRFGNRHAGKFINNLMRNGKKSLAERIFYEALEIAGTRARRPAIDVFEQALRNAMPMLEVKPRRVGGSTYQVPVEIKGERRQALAMRWLLRFARERQGKSMAEKLAAELLDAANGVGQTIKRKDDTHRMAEANRAFAHYRW
ncbi:MAG TPA: 30S ribosomal protein S7 [Chloroflexota bacterium]|nr:30S ribosomal protein S7 [Chloroflexota bacterium]